MKKNKLNTLKLKEKKKGVVGRGKGRVWLHCNIAWDGKQRIECDLVRVKLKSEEGLVEIR